MHIVVDTTAIHNDFKLANPVLRLILKEAPRAGYVVAFPEVVLREFENQYREELDRTWVTTHLAGAAATTAVGVGALTRHG